VVHSSGFLTQFDYNISRKKSNIEVFQNIQIGEEVNSLQNNIGKTANFIITEKSYKKAEENWADVLHSIKANVSVANYSQQDIKEQARKVFSSKICIACKKCDGQKCVSSIPGMGGYSTFQENSKALSKIKIHPQYLIKDNSRLRQVEFCVGGLTPTHTKPPVSILNQLEKKLERTIFGQQISAPIMNAPITGAQTNLGGAISEWDLNIEMAEALTSLNLLPMFGDSATKDKYLTSIYTLKYLQEQSKKGIIIFKPRANIEDVIKRIKRAEQARALAWGMDIDSVLLKTFTNKRTLTKKYSIEEIQLLASCSKLPFLLKGIMSIEDAEAACISGASAIIVSNHGGRILDSMPATATVLPKISQYVKTNFPYVKVFVDGGIRSGEDIYKMLSLGADAVLIGRPLVISAVAYRRNGIVSILNRYIDELKKTIILCD